MPWRTTGVLEERLKFVLAYVAGEGSVAELARTHGISRKTAYKFLSRFPLEGVAGLQDRSRAPHAHPNAITPGVVELLLQARRRHPTWGARKLLPYLARRYPGLVLPAASTVSRLLRVQGLAARRARRRPLGGSAAPGRGTAPNDLWSADFKGWFRAGNGERCEPLTITDHASRFGLACDVLERGTLPTVRPVFERIFREYGLPGALRTDNGLPFASTGLGGLTRLSAWWIRLGIRPERIAPGQPQQNGRHERFHRTLQEATARPPSPTRRAQQRASDAFLREYNYERPHAALGDRPPADVYVPSARPYPTHLAPLAYPPDCEVRRVQSCGHMKWRGQDVFVSQALVGQHVGLRQTADDQWRLYFGPVELARFDARQRKVLPLATPLWTDPEPIADQEVSPMS